MGFDTNEIHTPDGSAHSAWWTATSQGAIMRALHGLQSKPDNPAAAAVTKHSDMFLYSIAYNVRMGGKKAAYDAVSSYQVKPGKSEDWSIGP